MTLERPTSEEVGVAQIKSVPLDLSICPAVPKANLFVVLVASLYMMSPRVVVGSAKPELGVVQVKLCEPSVVSTCPREPSDDGKR